MGFLMSDLGWYGFLLETNNLRRFLQINAALPCGEAAASFKGLAGHLRLGGGARVQFRVCLLPHRHHHSHENQPSLHLPPRAHSAPTSIKDGSALVHLDRVHLRETPRFSGLGTWQGWLRKWWNW